RAWAHRLSTCASALIRSVRWRRAARAAGRGRSSPPRLRSRSPISRGKGFSVRSRLRAAAPCARRGGPRGRASPSPPPAGLAYLRALETGVRLGDARRMIFFRLAADADQFLSMAKFRAARRLWARIEAACGLAPEPGFVSAETAWRMMTKRDPWVNLLRTTV